MELSTVGNRRNSQPPSSLHHHHYPQKHLQQQQKHAELSKTIGQTGNVKCPSSPPFVHSKKQQCRYPEDPDSIESIHDDESIKLKHLSKTIGHKGHAKWTIPTKKAQMNQYETGNVKSPTATAGQQSYFVHKLQTTDATTANLADMTTSINAVGDSSEYSYAYCEPIVNFTKPSSPESDKAPSLASQQPTSAISTSLSNNTLSRGPSAHLLRALLTKSFRKGSPSSSLTATTTTTTMTSMTTPTAMMHLSDKHTFRTRYGTKENIYEDVGDIGIRPKLSRSTESINKLPLTDELQFVQKQHDRIMGELNLSIEALLMPSKDETEEMERRRAVELEQEQLLHRTYRSYRSYHNHHHHRHLHSDACYVESSLSTLSSNQILQPPYSSHCPAEFDSGISGSSSSGASYSSSMRYRPITCPPPLRQRTMGTTVMGGVSSGAPSTSSHSSSSSQLGNRPPSDPVTLFHNSCQLSCCLYGVDHQILEGGSMAHLDCADNAQPIESISEKVNFWNKIGKMYSPGSPKQQSPVNGKYLNVN